MEKENLDQITTELKKVKNGELIIDGIKLKKISLKIKNEIEKIKNLHTLSMNNCDLENLDNLPKLENLIRLEIMGNKFNSEELKKIIIYKNLECASLGENKIEKIEVINFLDEFENLVQLDLTGTALSKKNNYRKNLFEKLKSLIILDNKDFNDKSFDFSESESFSQSDFENGKIFISDEEENDFSDCGDEIEDFGENNSKNDSGKIIFKNESSENEKTLKKKNVQKRDSDSKKTLKKLKTN